MTVLTLSQAKVLVPRAFGSGEPSPRCDMCEEKWTCNRRPMATAYGPFTVWCCFPCSIRVAKNEVTRKANAWEIANG